MIGQIANWCRIGFRNVFQNDLGAVGYYLSFSYLALAIGTVAAGWLSDKLQRRKTPIMLVMLM
jgi:MFS family permease